MSRLSVKKLIAAGVVVLGLLLFEVNPGMGLLVILLGGLPFVWFMCGTRIVRVLKGVVRAFGAATCPVCGSVTGKDNALIAAIAQTFPVTCRVCGRDGCGLCCHWHDAGGDSHDIPPKRERHFGPSSVTVMTDAPWVHASCCPACHRTT